VEQGGDSGGSTITIEPEPSAIFTSDTWDRPGEWVVVLYGYRRWWHPVLRLAAGQRRSVRGRKGEPGTLYFQEPGEANSGP
jgi:hypothetical protein